MQQLMLAAGLGIMSLVVVVEAVWLTKSLSHEPRFKWLFHPRLIVLLRTLFLLGLPYISMISGLLPARYFGFTGLEHLVSIGFNQPWPRLFTELQTFLGTVLLAWLPIVGPAALVGLGALLSVGLALLFYYYLHRSSRGLSLASFPERIYSSTFELFLDAVHWAFYRAIVWLLTDNLYVAVWGGVIWLGIELTAASRLGKASPVQQQQYLWRVLLATLTSVSFFFAPDFWLTVTLQLGLVWLIQTGLKAASQSQSDYPLPS